MEGRNGGRLRQDPSARDAAGGCDDKSPQEPASAFARRRTILETRGLAVLPPREGQAARDGAPWAIAWTGSENPGARRAHPKSRPEGGLNVRGKIFAGFCPLVQVILAWTGPVG